MSAARFIVGDTRAVTASLPDGSVDLVLTSPPFLALRSYLPADHPDKPFEIGSEATPAEFLQVLLELTAEWRRVLAPHGSICVELGDTYSGSGGAGGDYNDGGLRDGQEKFDGSARRGRGRAGGEDGRPSIPDRKHYTVAKGGADWPLPKSLCGIPHLYHLSLAYGINLLTGETSPAGRWRVRNVVAWCRPNPPVGALGDKFRPATSYMTIATVAQDRYFDLDAVRVPFTGHPGIGTGVRKGQNGDKPEDNRPDDLPTRMNTHDGAPPLDWWSISTQPYKGSHYATWPEALCDRPILSMVPSKVCTTCGEPSRRLTEPTSEYAEALKVPWREDGTEGRRAIGRSGYDKPTMTADRETVGWTDCGHNTWRRGIVLDPFAGSGTTLKIAVAHGRDALGIDIDERNASLALERVGMFLTVEHYQQEVVA